MTDVRFLHDDGRAVLEISGTGPRPTGVTLEGPRARVTGRLRGRGRTWRAELPLRAARWGGPELPLPTGEYRLRIEPGEATDAAPPAASLPLTQLPVLRAEWDGRRLLVIHGDQFDIVVRHAKWLAFLGDWAYTAALGMNTWLNVGRRKIGLTYWSLSAWAKLKVKNAVNFIGKFEDALSAEARRRDVDGVVCGHIHHAALHDLAGVSYINTGDWVESCTAVIESHDGTLELVYWASSSRSLVPVAAPGARAAA